MENTHSPVAIANSTTVPEPEQPIPESRATTNSAAISQEQQPTKATDAVRTLPTGEEIPVANEPETRPQAPVIPIAPEHDEKRAPVTNTRAFKRIQAFSEDDLRTQLAHTAEIGLGPTAGRVLKEHLTTILGNRRISAQTNQTDPTPLLKVRPDLLSLPYRQGAASQLSPQAARTLGSLAPKLHSYLDLLAPPKEDGSRPATRDMRIVMRQEKRGSRSEWLRPEAIPTMQQLLMHEDAPFRLMLVDLLGEINDGRSSVALARRAVFDLSAEVRQAAVEALKGKGRRAGDWRPVFLQALRYPWPAAAEHAAEALAALRDQEAVPHLVALLDQPDPGLPVTLDKQRTIVRELVRADHLNNCLMCHAPSMDGKEPALGVDPNLIIPTRGPTTTTVIGRWVRNSSQPGTAPLLIRADITFLRQDFSTQLPTVIPALKTIRNRRFDFVVRSQPVSQKLAEKLRNEARDRTSYRQRDAVLFALRELTGKDAGNDTEAWQKLYPRAEVDVAAARLRSELLQADVIRRQQLLMKLCDGNGKGHTEALARSIPSLSGPFQEKVRDALVRRLSRLPLEELRAKLQDEDAEVRRAAVRGCVDKKDHEAIPALTALLEDVDPIVARQAEVALNRLANEEEAEGSGAK